MGILIRELAALYAAFARGRPSPLAGAGRSSTPTSPSGSAVSQRREGCRHSSPLAPAPGGRAGARAADRPPAAAQQSYRGAGRFTSSAGAQAALKELSRRRGGDALHDAARRLGGPARALHRRRDIVVGTPIANRNRPRDRGADRLLRQHPRPAHRPRRRPVLRGSAGARAGRRWAPTPTRTCRSSSWWRSCSPSAISAASPLFQVMFVLQNAPAAPAAARSRRSALAWRSRAGRRSST